MKRIRFGITTLLMLTLIVAITIGVIRPAESVAIFLACDGAHLFSQCPYEESVR